MKVRFFSWIRERVGVPEDEILCPEDIATVSQLIDFMVSSYPDRYAHAFCDRTLIHVAINHVFADLSSPIDNSSDIAFFPPVTGG